MEIRKNIIEFELQIFFRFEVRTTVIMREVLTQQIAGDEKTV